MLASSESARSGKAHRRPVAVVQRCAASSRVTALKGWCSRKCLPVLPVLPVLSCAVPRDRPGGRCPRGRVFRLLRFPGALPCLLLPFLPAHVLQAQQLVSTRLRGREVDDKGT